MTAVTIESKVFGCFAEENKVLLHSICSGL